VRVRAQLDSLWPWQASHGAFEIDSPCTVGMAASSKGRLAHGSVDAHKGSHETVGSFRFISFVSQQRGHHGVTLTFVPLVACHHRLPQVVDHFAEIILEARFHGARSHRDVSPCTHTLTFRASPPPAALDRCHACQMGLFSFGSCG
jgi:hypothetical protein